jgi:hypothetical protein
MLVPGRFTPHSINAKLKSEASMKFEWGEKKVAGGSGCQPLYDSHLGVPGAAISSEELRRE